MWNFFFTRGQLKKWKKNAKSAPRKRICWVGWGRGVFWNFYFTRMQIKPKIL